MSEKKKRRPSSSPFSVISIFAVKCSSILEKAYINIWRHAKLALLWRKQKENGSLALHGAGVAKAGGSAEEMKENRHRPCGYDAKAYLYISYGEGNVNVNDGNVSYEIDTACGAHPFCENTKLSALQKRRQLIF
jgi:hypothetical protein